MLTVLTQTLVSLLLSLMLVNPTFGYQDQEQSQKINSGGFDKQEQPQRVDAGKPDELEPPVEFRIKYLKPSELMVVLKQLMSKSSDATIAHNDEQKVLFVRHTKKWLDAIKEIVAKLDVAPGPERQVTLSMQIILASTVEGRGNAEAEKWREVTDRILQSYLFKSFYALPSPISIGVITGQEDVKKEGQITINSPFVDSPITVSYKLGIAEVLNDESMATSGVTLKGLYFVMTAGDPPVSFGSPVSRKLFTLKPSERLLVLPDKANDRQIILVLASAPTTQ